MKCVKEGDTDHPRHMFLLFLGHSDARASFSRFASAEFVPSGCSGSPERRELQCKLDSPCFVVIGGCSASWFCP